MSRSKPTASTNPAQRFFKWSSAQKALVWWDKENKQEVPVELPFSFLVLDELATITGYSDRDNSGYWSNEVRNILKDEFTVRTQAGIKETAVYRELDTLSKGAKYAKSVYIAYKDGEEFVMGNIKLYGAALTAWIELSGKYDTEKGKVSLTGSVEGKKGATTFFTPVFEWSASDEAEDSAAIELDKTLQEYLDDYLEADHSKPAEKQDKDVVIEDIGDDPINLDDIPF